MVSFQAAAAVLGAVLIGGALLSGLARRSFLSLTALIVALAGRWLIGLSWTEAFLLDALLSPTDPVLTSSIVTNLRCRAWCATR